VLGGRHHLLHAHGEESGAQQAVSVLLPLWNRLRGRGEAAASSSGPANQSLVLEFSLSQKSSSAEVLNPGVVLVGHREVAGKTVKIMNGFMNITFDKQGASISGP